MTPTGRCLWTPLMVALAYLPDIAKHLLVVVGLSGWQVAAHSVVFALVAAAVGAVAVRGTCGVSLRRAFAVCVFSLLAHDVLDLLQATDRQPLWPFSTSRFGAGAELIPTGGVAEIAFFMLPLAVVLLVRRLATRVSKGSGAAVSMVDRRAVWFGRTLTALIVGAAATTHWLRSERQSQLNVARAFLSEGEFAAAVDALGRADRWPQTAKAGRIEYLEALAVLGLGRREEAEQLFLSSRRADPGYFWSLADLCVFLASTDESLVVRRSVLEPFLAELRRDFAHDPDLDRILAKITRRMVPGVAIDSQVD
jgi:membrane-bound metal-dependent hydrolase YbcI (DUF457 family)